VTDQTPAAGSPGAESTGDPASDAAFARSILDTAHEAFVSLDAAGRVVGWNRAAQETFGYSHDEMVGRDLADAIVPERQRGQLRRRLSAGDGTGLDERVELSAIHRDGDEFPIEMTISGAGPDGAGAATFLAFLHDVSDRHLSEQVLRAMRLVTTAMTRADTPQGALEAMLEQLGQDMAWDIGAFWGRAQDGMLDLVAGWSSGATDASEFQRLSGQLRLEPGAGLPGQALERREPVWIEDYGGDPGMLRARAARTAGLRSAICVPTTREGEVVGVIEFLCREQRVRNRSIVGALTTVGGHVGELLGVLDERHALLRRLETLALTDQLTGLPNRRALMEAVYTAKLEALALVIVDIDRFKRVNDTHGHLVGDAVIRSVGQMMAGDFKGIGQVARVGGEEFALISSGASSQSLTSALTAFCERVRSTPVLTNGVAVRVTVSAGIALRRRDETFDQLYSAADRALYAAKAAGRNRVRFSDGGEQSRDRDAIEPPEADSGRFSLSA
jgi:diguanylate cyclase (GGDEF)-like protein/PAS domain S-box-containing protein